MIKSMGLTRLKRTETASAAKAHAELCSIHHRFINVFSESFAGLCARQSGGTAFGQYCGDRLPQDLEIEAERPVFDVAQVKANSVIALKVGASTDLPQASKTRGHQ
jgi:hypothetical protein